MSTIPMRAQKSNSSWSSQTGTGLGPSLRVMQRTTRGEHKRFMFSVALFAFTIVGLVAGSVGGVIQDASARENNRQSWYWNSQSTRYEENRYAKDDEDQKEEETAAPVTQKPATQTSPQTSPQTTTPQQPAPAQPAPAPTPATQARTTPAPQAPTSPQVQSTVAPAAPIEAAAIETPIADTTEAIATMTAAQAETTPKAVTYESQQISNEMRDRLLTLAASALASGAIIFIMSLFGTTGATPTLIQYRTPVSEVISR